MASCQNKQVDNIVIKGKTDEIEWKHFLRQLLACSAFFTTYFVAGGLCMGAPTVVIPQLKKNNTTAISDEMTSWLSSAISYSAIPWVLIFAAISERLGRRIPFYFAISCSIIGLFVMYFGNTAIHVFICQVFQGIVHAVNHTVSIILITELTSPKYRGSFLAIKSASAWWGIWASNAIGTFFKWNYIGLFGLICSLYYITVFLWPESPYWLASKGRFDECATAHRWFKGVGMASEDELKKLIDSQKEYYLNNKPKKRVTLRDHARNFLRAVHQKEFYMPVLLSTLVIAQYHSTGKIVCCIYSIEMIKKITENESTAYTGMLILDGVSVAGMYFGSLLSKFISRRVLIIVPSSIGIACLFCMSLYVWLIKHSFVIENNIVSIFLLSAFSISISCGPMIMCISIYAELIPLRFQSLAMIICTLIHFSLMGTSIKMAPLLFKYLSLHGTFLLYAILSSMFTFILYKYLPETKDKTLQEIEEYFKDNKNIEDVKEAKEAKELIELNREL